MAADPRPGTTYFVPGARVMRLSELRASSDPGTEIPEIAPDIVKVEVTRVNTGSCQYSITLNNWYDTLPADRENSAGRGETLQDSRPIWPRFKYNALDFLAFGTRLRIDFRYWPDPIEGLSETDEAAQRWVPMIAGPITDMKFTFSASEGARLTVTGEDDLRKLKDKNKKKVAYTNRNEEDIVNDVLRRAEFPLSLAEPLVTRPAFFIGAKTLSEAHDEGQTSLEYLQKFSDRYDFEVFLEFSDLDDPAAPLSFHIEPARSRTPPDKVLRDIHVLERGRNLVEFTPTFKVLDQVTTLTIKGRHRDRNRPEQVSTTALGTILSDELHTDTERNDPPLVAGPLVRQQFYGDNEDTHNNESNLDGERGQTVAEAKMRKKAREFLTIDCKTIGLPRLRAGLHTEIRGLRPPFDGFYYVTETVHSYSDAGLMTTLKARRPGMPLPPYGEGS